MRVAKDAKLECEVARMSANEGAILPCCWVKEQYREVAVEGHRELRCGTCGNLMVEIHGNTAKIPRHVAAWIEAQEGYGPLSNPLQRK